MKRVVIGILLALLPASRGAADEPVEIRDWAAPPLWSPGGRETATAGLRPESLSTIPTPPLPLVGISPCRVADTRGNGFSGAYGPPSLAAGSPRNFTLTGQCGIAGTAQAVSLNVTVTNAQGPGFLLVYPQGEAQPLVSTLNYLGGQTVANAAVVPLGTGGGITVVAGVSGADLLIDTNGYYDNTGLITAILPGTGLAGGGSSGNVTLGIAPGGVTSSEIGANAVTASKIAANAVTSGAIAPGQVVRNLNGLSDSVTLAAGANVTITSSTQTLTIAASGGPPFPAGAFVLGKPGDTTLIGAGFTETGFTQDFWKRTAGPGAPSPRTSHIAVWTGNRMIVWGGYEGFVSPTNTGGRYDPVSDTWTSTTTTGAPSARASHAAVWTGTRMIVWGGTNNDSTGGVYDPVGDSWTATATSGAPAGRQHLTAVWTDSRMIVWGGSQLGTALNTGGIYDPGNDSWVATGAGAPGARESHTAVWTGSTMVVWGGRDGSTYLNTGGRFDPSLNFWTGGVTTFGAPSGRIMQTAVWTGSSMIVWGGWDGTNYLTTGGQYDPNGNVWTSATSTVGVPSGCASHTALWTGRRMVVWGGRDAFNVFNTGGQYDPAADAWIATSTGGAPSPRQNHTAVWTGTKMIVWGGDAGPLAPFGDGSQYAILSLYSKN